MDTELSELTGLTEVQREALRNGHFVLVTDILHAGPEELSSKTGLSYNRASELLADVAFEVAYKPVPLASLVPTASQKISTGDTNMDIVLGGGIRPGLIWEFAGEGGAGKTQLALQLALMVQMLPRLGGVSGSCCYLSSWKELPTSRLQQLIDLHPMIRGSTCTLDHLHFRRTETISALLNVLEGPLVQLIQGCRDTMPLKLLILDDFTSLFRTDKTDKATSGSLIDRSRDLAEVSALIHQLAIEHNLAVIVVNEVVNVFEPEAPAPVQSEPTYRAVSPWFNTAANVPGEDAREPALGLSWANQVNVRVFFSRTGRRRILDVPMSDAKRQKFAQETGRLPHEIQPSDEPVLIRHMSVIFSSVAAPSSVDYVITDEGVSSEGEPSYTAR
ncbi:P-loop containing nucleoside triphosphate hydrolase protein [Exidia glandulosa HHB12029]|uniref:p-loop containing nucleoside triphosphate hydrolase protein n=1 Tax=Exidia glandulosa HHB12029 TaxID=1314781 RepID=A0A165BIY2_EXIGL|nr:P-loop containing nucleoside triphosphate hydrolase protein [Exidia glandulosa HHB12029]